MNSFEINWKDDLTKQLMIAYIRAGNIQPLKVVKGIVNEMWDDRMKTIRESDEPLEIKER